MKDARRENMGLREGRIGKPFKARNLSLLPTPYYLNP
jgi:hypothetical protein